MAADPSKLSFFSLPGEIRNKIMNLVLVPGDVYPHTLVPDSSTRVPVSAANVQSRSGVQLIATCRQAYDEGHALFYSSNTFHLPVTMTFEWSDRLQPKHKFLIKRIGITIGPNELDASMIHHIDRNYQKLSGHGEHDSPAILEAVMEALDKTWYSKMSHIVAWTSLEEIKLRLFKDIYHPTIPLNHNYTLQDHERTLPYHERTLQHCELVANLEKWGYWYQFERPYWGKILQWPSIIASANIAAKNDEIPWTAVLEWLYVREPSELAGDLADDWASYFWEYIEHIENAIWGLDI